MSMSLAGKEGRKKKEVNGLLFVIRKTIVSKFPLFGSLSPTSEDGKKNVRRSSGMGKKRRLQPVSSSASDGPFFFFF